MQPHQYLANCGTFCVMMHSTSNAQLITPSSAQYQVVTGCTWNQFAKSHLVTCTHVIHSMPDNLVPKETLLAREYFDQTVGYCARETVSLLIDDGSEKEGGRWGCGSKIAREEDRVR